MVREGQSGWIWAQRMARSVPGSRPAPACLFVPSSSFREASTAAKAITQKVKWPSLVRKSKRCNSSYEVKVILPSGLSAGIARAALAKLAGVE